MAAPGNILLVDLNNYARYPTMAIAYLVAPLRAAGFNVVVKTPWSVGAEAIEHERHETWREHLIRTVNFGTHPVMQRIHEPLRAKYSAWQVRSHKLTVDAVPEWLTAEQPDVVLLSAYLQHYDIVCDIAAQARLRGIPVLLGGPAFSTEETVADWLKIDGVTAIMAGEADSMVADLVTAAVAGGDLRQWPGVNTSDGPNSKRLQLVGSQGVADSVAPPLHDLDQLPIPDYDDFPWDSYPHRIIPIMTGRGCGWGRCTFCSDVTTSNGRTYRSRSLPVVLNELEQLSKRYQTKDFIFLDLKLNSDLDVWHGVINNIQDVVDGARWIATVHVDGTGDNGLSFETLSAARAAGLRRISFGMESGSEKLLRRMSKGSKVEQNEEFIQAASEAGLSLRSTMILGYPGETTEDLELTADLLDRTEKYFDRIRVARFKAIPGTRFENQYKHRPDRFDGLGEVQWDHRFGRAIYKYSPATDKDYRRAKKRILNSIHRINRKPLVDGAQQFDGLM